MNRKLRIRNYIWVVLALVSVVLLIFAVSTPRSVGDTASEARKVQRHLVRRMDRLDWYMSHTQARLPDDMVIYTYAADTLQSWRGQFPLFNDDISTRVVMQRITNPRVNILSPLSYVTEEPSYMNIGPNWYIVRSTKTESGTVISALLIIDNLYARSYNGVNPRLHLGMRFSVRPLTFSEGTPVRIDGLPVFKILYDSLSGEVVADPVLMWMALLLFLLAGLMYVFDKRTFKRAAIACAAILMATGAMYFWGRSVQNEYALFSPVTYAGGNILFSLGAVLLFNLAILMCVTVLYLARRDTWAKVRNTRLPILVSALEVLAVAGVLVYTHLSLRSIVANSNISLEIYKLGTISVYTFLVYASFLSLLTTIPMLLQMLLRRYNMFSSASCAVSAVLAAGYLVTTTAVLGFEKEEDRMEVWAGKLAVDRDVNLELQLLNIEPLIAGDAVISALAGLDGSEVIIRNRIVDNYFQSESLDYSVYVQIFHPEASPAAIREHFEFLQREGTPIADASSFIATPTSEGPSNYVGVFPFVGGGRLSYVLVEVSPKTALGGKAYARLLSLSAPGRTTLPAAYSYSRYQGRELRLFKGSYPYSTRMDDWMYEKVYADQVCHYNRDGYAHFVNVITDNEAVIISRAQVSVISYIVAALFIGLLMSGFLTCLKPRRQGRRDRSRTYFRSRISMTLMVSLLLAMVIMAAVSVIFVYQRNEANQQAIMSDRINSIQLLTDAGLHAIESRDVLSSPEFASLIQSVSDNTNSDISVYSTGGRIVLCTNPEALDRGLVGYRIEEEALDRILKLNKRYCILKEHIGRRHYHNMYMPLMDANGKVIAVLCSPYVEESYDFERDAVMHSMFVLSVFLLLFILARLFESAVLDRVFRPLSMMQFTMSKAGQGDLEHIDYGRTDEISALVDAYNRMVDELAENSKQLAQAERDKAWSGMARQVAHEIKNPLTPMKLQIQRLIRLKQKGDPSWQDKFDDVSRVLLDHIDILTETSNEFSTFAKLYSEEHTRIDLDRMLQEEISMFDNREDVEFTYMGLADAFVLGPRPQLTRVFVNLLGNAVQAVEGRGGARINVSLRKSVRDGYYDIVVEDNGSGVAEENISKLFTPNFTTKNGGSGLGLAISRSILEKCGATIAYSRSFTLAGACFTIQYPAEQ
ncbi:MAG: hypothetical protein IJU68_07840 [Bacteroidales bacterium]|nr:hypothetical protein [Bacteroidales bacterium]